jgi:hypothetical protein
MPEEVKKSLIGDLAGLSEPLKKLVEVVSSGLGRFTGSMWLDKRDADNEAYKILKIGGAQTQVAVDRMKAVAALGSGNIPQVQKLTLAGNEVNAELSDGQQAVLALKARSDDRAEYQNLLHQLNTEQTISFAAEELAQEGKVVSDEPVDDNWKSRYFSIIQEISGEELQLLWGKILAGEVCKPNSYSLRTLEVLRNITKSEAEIFAKACNYLIVSTGTKSNHYSFFRNGSGNKGYDGIEYNDILLLQECGLVKPVDDSGFPFSANINNEFIRTFHIANRLLIIEGKEVDNFTMRLPIYLLTKAGAEISHLIKKENKDDYIMEIAKLFKGRKLKALVADFDKWEDGHVSYTGELRELAID